MHRRGLRDEGVQYIYQQKPPRTVNRTRILYYTCETAPTTGGILKINKKIKIK